MKLRDRIRASVHARRKPRLPDGWELQPYNPLTDEAPEGHPEHDCDGDHEEDE